MEILKDERERLDRFFEVCKIARYALDLSIREALDIEERGLKVPSELQERSIDAELKFLTATDAFFSQYEIVRALEKGGK